jgi:hypothetical protein
LPSSPANIVSPDTAPPPGTANATGNKYWRKRLSVEMDDQLFATIKRHALRMNKSLSATARFILEAQLMIAVAAYLFRQGHRRLWLLSGTDVGHGYWLSSRHSRSMNHCPFS